MGDSLKDKTIAGMLWTGLGKFGTMGLMFVSNLVLARLLLPRDFGAIGMLNVFIAISGILVTAGFGTALVQKKDPLPVDFTSVFYWNLFMAILLYAVLFACSPAISRFYKMPELMSVLRVQSLSLIIQAFSMVQATLLQKQLRFKELAIRNVFSTLCGTTVAIVMAFLGFGVWSLVASSLVTSTVAVFLLWGMSSWRPSWEFSFGSLKSLFAFGGLMALSSMVETIYSNLQSLIIGRYYSAADLGYYSQAQKLQEVPTQALSQIVNDVSFPVFSSIQDDSERLLYVIRKNIKTITYVNFPLMVLLIIIAKPVILLLYGDNWETSVPYFQILCVSAMIYTLNTLNTNVIKSLGKGKVYLFTQLAKRLIGIALIITGTLLGIYGLLWAVALMGYICALINMGVNKRLIAYGFGKQIKDVAGYYLTSIILGIAVYFGNSLLDINMYVNMCLMILEYIILYVGISFVFKFEGLFTYIEIIKKMKK